jgi:hypothetical protein
MRHLLFFIAIVQSFFSFSQNTFQLALGGAQEEFAYSFQQTNDNGYIVAGRTFSFGTGGWECYMSRFNSNGDTLWTKTYGNVLYDELQDVDTTSDGGFIAVGHTTTTDWDGNVYLIKTNANGIVQWSKEYGGSIGFSDKGYSVRETSDGGFIIAGSTESYGSGGDDVYVLKVNALGVLQWTTTIGSAGTASVMDAGREVQETNDGGFIVVGYTSAVDINFSDVYLVKLNAAGVVQWKKTYGGNSYDIGYTVQQTTDNGFIIGATTNSYGAGNWDAYLLKTDANGVLQWSKTYGKSGEDRAQCARQTQDGGFILCGRSTGFGTGNFDVALYRTDLNGNLLWTKGYGGAGDDQGFYVRPIGNSFVFCGYTVSFGAGIKDLFLMKSDANGIVGCNEISGTGFSTLSPSTITNSVGNNSTGGGAITASTATRNTLSVKSILCSSMGNCTINSSFTASSTSICIDGTVNFTNSSTGAATQNWFVNGTSFSNSVNASRIFQNPGVYQITLIAYNGTCSDTSTVNILVSSPSAASISNTACESYTWPLNGQTYLQSGVYTTTISNAAGCDSIITLNLTINQPTDSSETVTNCVSYTWPVNGQTYNQSGIYTTTYTNALGCLSTKTLYLTINQSSSSILNETAIDSYSLNGQIYDQSGTFTQIIQNSVGCDSIITLNLTLSTSTIDELIEATVIVYPNPTNDLLTIKLSSETNENYILTDSGGRKLLEGQLNGIETQVTLKELNIGLYFLQIGKERLTIRVVRQ